MNLSDLVTPFDELNKEEQLELIRDRRKVRIEVSVFTHKKRKSNPKPKQKTKKTRKKSNKKMDQIKILMDSLGLDVSMLEEIK